ncbi:MAG: DUF1656 domain-containing protein [Methylocystis sp.]
MTGEIDVFGVLAPELLVYAITALLLQALLNRVIAALRIDRMFWHPPILELCGFVICLGGVAAVAHWGWP